MSWPVQMLMSPMSLNISLTTMTVENLYRTSDEPCGAYYAFEGGHWVGLPSRTYLPSLLEYHALTCLGTAIAHLFFFFNSSQLSSLSLPNNYLHFPTTLFFSHHLPS
jgi:hypothetical protein